MNRSKFTLFLSELLGYRLCMTQRSIYVLDKSEIRSAHTDCARDIGEILLIGFAVPDEVMETICQEDQLPSIQTHKFSWSLIRGIEAHLHGPLGLVSAVPVMDYPRNTRLYFRGCVWTRPEGGTIRTIWFINLLVFKQVTRLITSFLAGLDWIRVTAHTHRQAIIIYGVHTPFLFVGLLLSRMIGIPVIGIWTDPPGVPTKGDGVFKSLIRGIDYRLACVAMRKMDGCVALTRDLADYFSPTVPFLVMEGIADITVNDYIETGSAIQEDEKTFIVMYAGSLRECYGVGMLIEGFRQSADSSCRLWLFGKGDMEDEIKQIALADDRIIYYGFQPNKEVLKAARSASILINPRPSQCTFTRYSFPSKIIEYMLTGTPTATTRLPGIPTEYFKYLLLIEDESAEGVANLLRDLRSQSRSDLRTLGAKASDYIRIYKNPDRQGRRVIDFILSLASPRTNPREDNSL